MAKDNHKVPAGFVCNECGCTANPDINGVGNLLAAEHAVLACGGTMHSGPPVKQESGTQRLVATQ
jgi:putative transposase